MENAGCALDVALGERIRARRRQLGISQTNLGDQLHVSFQQVKKYERGQNRISFSTLVRVAQTLECRVAQLIGDIDELPSPPARRPPSPPAFTPSETEELLDAYAGIQSPDLRRSLLHLAHALAMRSDGDGG